MWDSTETNELIQMQSCLCTEPVGLFVSGAVPTSRDRDGCRYDVGVCRRRCCASRGIDGGGRREGGPEHLEGEEEVEGWGPQVEGRQPGARPSRGGPKRRARSTEEHIHLRVDGASREASPSVLGCRAPMLGAPLGRRGTLLQGDRALPLWTQTRRAGEVRAEVANEKS